MPEELTLKKEKALVKEESETKTEYRNYAKSLPAKERSRLNRIADQEGHHANFFRHLEHIPRGEGDPEGTRFSVHEDKEAKAIARSEQKAHPDWSKQRAMSVGYATIQTRRNNLKRKRR